MDHFALKHDSLYKAMQSGTLNRNFMGYTTTQSKVLLGLGVSSISDSWTGFSQNVKEIDSYLNALKNNQLPLLKGHIATQEDVRVRKQILEIMCQFATTWNDEDFTLDEQIVLKNNLSEFERDGILSFDSNSLSVHEKGKPFVRNICMAFDKRMLREKTTTKLFSQVI
jgi:oxygen-independent coproporphyrinogen III oxidase